MNDFSTPILSRDVRQRGLVPPDRLARCHAIVIGVGADDRIFSGFASNFTRHPAEQKKYSRPSCGVV